DCGTTKLNAQGGRQIALQSGLKARLCVPMARIRLDQLVVDKGLAPSRERAKAVVLAGLVSVNGHVVSKAGTLVDAEAEVTLDAPDHPYVGRGGLKLAHALDTFRLRVGGRDASDV